MRPGTAGLLQLMMSRPGWLVLSGVRRHGPAIMILAAVRMTHSYSVRNLKASEATFVVCRRGRPGPPDPKPGMEAYAEASADRVTVD